MKDLLLKNKSHHELVAFSNNMETGVLARKAILSQGQILQLELGETSLFYSQAIQEKAARKVALLLGGDPDLVIRADEPSDADTQTKPTVVDALIQLKKSQSHAVESRWRLTPSLWGALALIILGGVGVIGIEVMFNEVITRFAIGIFENSNAPAVKNSAASLVPEVLEQPQSKAEEQAPQLPVSLWPQPRVTDSNLEAVRSAPRVQVRYAVTVENPVELPDVTLVTTE